MNKENPILQRDQIKRPSFCKLVNTNYNGLSSPFPFMEFGISSQSSLNNVLHSFNRENRNPPKYISSKIDNLDQKLSPVTDPYLKPLSLDRLKSANSLNRETNSLQYGHNFMRISSHHLRNNDFSENFFLRVQSTRTNNVDNMPKKFAEPMKNNKELSKIIPEETNGLTKIIREKRPITSILTPKNLTAASDINKESTTGSQFNDLSAMHFENSLATSKTSQIRPKTAGAVLKLSKESSADLIMSNIAASSYMRMKADADIYNARMSIDKKTGSGPQASFKSQNSQNLYLQVKQEVEEYRLQRSKESLLDINNYPNIRAISSEELFQNSETNKGKENGRNEIGQSKMKEKNMETTLNGNVSGKVEERIGNSHNDGKVAVVIGQKTLREHSSNRSNGRPKSVTFNEHVETRDFFGDSRLV